MTNQLIAELDAYEGHAYAVTFSPDGHRLLVGGFGGLIRAYDTTSWEEVAQYVHHKKSTNHIAFAPMAKPSPSHHPTAQSASGNPTLTNPPPSLRVIAIR